MDVKTLSLAASVVVGAAGSAMFFGARGWTSETEAFVARLDSSVSPGLAFNRQELERLPAPVARYLDRAIEAGRPPVQRAEASWSGEFRVGNRADRWRRFEATQVWVTNPSGFVWEATIHMAPGLPVRVRDVFVDGHGRMRAALPGMVPIVDAHDAPELDEGALQRHLAEAVWFPTALLPSQGVTWTPLLTATSARATLVAGGVSASLDFHFGVSGLVDRISTTSRFRAVDRGYVATPWAATVGDYAERAGLTIPLRGEVAWVIDQKVWPYWRGKLDTLTVTPGP